MILLSSWNNFIESKLFLRKKNVRLVQQNYFIDSQKNLLNSTKYFIPMN